MSASTSTSTAPTRRSRERVLRLPFGVRILLLRASRNGRPDHSAGFNWVYKGFIARAFGVMFVAIRSARRA